MIWTPEVYKEIRNLVYTNRQLITEELIAGVGEAHVMEQCEGESRRALIRSAMERFSARILPGDVRTQTRLLPRECDPFRYDQNLRRYEFRARWFPATSEVLFQDGPLDGRNWTVSPTLFGQTIVAVQGPPIEPWFSVSDEIEPVRLNHVFYNLHSWDDELNVWVYRTT